MKLRIFILQLMVICSFLVTDLKAQEGKITYRTYYGRLAIASPANENGYPNEYEIEKAILHFDGSRSLYIQEQNKSVIRFMSGPNGTEKIETPRKNLDPYGTVYFLDYLSKMQLSRESFWNKATFVNIQEDILHINWKITNETKKIGKYNSFKAIASILGREWEAWFTPDIPVPVGPWRLNGLPGLILEAYDSSLDFMYQLAEVDIPHDFRPPHNVEDIFSGKLLSRSEFIKQNESRKEKHISYMKTVALENDGKVEIKFYPQIELSTNPKNK